jgi:hypothetical protein
MLEHPVDERSGMTVPLDKFGWLDRPRRTAGKYPGKGVQSCCSPNSSSPSLISSSLLLSLELLELLAELSSSLLSSSLPSSSLSSSSLDRVFFFFLGFHFCFGFFFFCCCVPATS